MENCSTMNFPTNTLKQHLVLNGIREKSRGKTKNISKYDANREKRNESANYSINDKEEELTYKNN